MQPTLVVSPEINFKRIEGELETLEWLEQPDTMSYAPILPGEPELAKWKHQSADGRIVYTFNPAVSMRVLTFYGDDAASLSTDVAARLPALSHRDVVELLKSEDVEKLLLGIFAAGELEDMKALVAITPLMGHREQLVVRAAVKTYEKLLLIAGEKELEKLAQEQARHPERSVFFPLLGGVHHRRQILRSLMHDYTEANEDILAVLRAALEDEDWEVRATAMLAAARLKATPLLNLVRKVELPTTSREGLDADARRLLRELRHAAVLLLEGHAPPEISPGAVDKREAARAHMLRCVAGLPVNNSDRVFLFVQSLTGIEDRG